MNTILDASNVIDSLGGTTAVARLCDIQPPSVSEWRRKGIPKPWMKFLRATRPDVFSTLDERSKQPTPPEAA